MINAFNWRQFSIDERQRQGIASNTSTYDKRANATAQVERIRQEQPEFGRVKFSKKPFSEPIGTMKRGKP